MLRLGKKRDGHKHRQAERERQTDRQTETETERDAHAHKDKDTQTERQTAQVFVLCPCLLTLLLHCIRTGAQGEERGWFPATHVEDAKEEAPMLFVRESEAHMHTQRTHVHTFAQTALMCCLLFNLSITASPSPFPSKGQLTSSLSLSLCFLLIKQTTKNHRRRRTITKRGLRMS